MMVGNKTFELNATQEGKLANLLQTQGLTDYQAKLIDEAFMGLTSLITLCGDDPSRDGLQESPFRVIKAFAEYTEGYREDPRLHLEKTFD
jgi:GTP cyclohydrolase I